MLARAANLAAGLNPVKPRAADDDQGRQEVQEVFIEFGETLGQLILLRSS